MMGRWGGFEEGVILLTESEGNSGWIESLTKVNKLEILAMKNVRDGN